MAAEPAGRVLPPGGLPKIRLFCSFSNPSGGFLDIDFTKWGDEETKPKMCLPQTQSPAVGRECCTDRGGLVQGEVLYLSGLCFLSGAPGDRACLEVHWPLCWRGRGCRTVPQVHYRCYHLPNPGQRWRQVRVRQGDGHTATLETRWPRPFHVLELTPQSHLKIKQSVCEQSLPVCVPSHGPLGWPALQLIQTRGPARPEAGQVREDETTSFGMEETEKFHISNPY